MRERERLLSLTCSHLPQSANSNLSTAGDDQETHLNAPRQNSRSKHLLEAQSSGERSMPTGSESIGSKSWAVR